VIDLRHSRSGIIAGHPVEWFDTLDSTMTLATLLARDKCPHGTIIGADEQTAGIGRQGHSWHSERGTGLYVSIVLRLAKPAPVITLALGLAVQEAIAQLTGLAPDLRWPNDVLIDGLKCAGILTQLDGDAVIAGIGINVSQAAFPPDLEATSLLLAGATVTRENVLATLVQAIDRCCSILQEQGPDAILRMFEASSSYAVGRRVRVDQVDGVVEGVTRGLDPAGFLIVRRDNGQDTTILAGGVRPCS
jgi:BirA family biotin operon repressor/biotin-[acetyl-CoA-carboxylase] ligase